MSKTTFIKQCRSFVNGHFDCLLPCSHIPGGLKLTQHPPPITLSDLPLRLAPLSARRLSVAFELPTQAQQVNVGIPGGFGLCITGLTLAAARPAPLIGLVPERGCCHVLGAAC